MGKIESTWTDTRVVLEELHHHPTGISAVELTALVTEKGVSESSAQRAIRRAIDSGKIGVGPGLELRMAENA